MNALIDLALRASKAIALAVLVCVCIGDAHARATVGPHVSGADIDPRAAIVIKQSGAALHVTALGSIRIIHARGNVVAAGLAGKGDNWKEMGGVREAYRFSTPPLGGGSGWDGKASWSLDQTGLVIIDGSALGRSSAIDQAFCANYDLWTPEYGGATVAWNASRSKNGRIYDVLTITPPKSSLPIDVWFDRATHLPAKFVQTAGSTVTSTAVADFRPVDGLLIPYRVDASTNAGDMTSFTASSVEANPPRGALQLTAPKSSPDDFSIADGATQASVPIQIVENHVYLDVMLDGRGPFRFELDTGGANVIDTAVSKELGLTRSGSTQVTGVGSGSSVSKFAMIRSLQIGRALVSHQVFIVPPLAKSVDMAHGLPIDGLIGYEVLSRFVTTLDYASKEIVLHMPGSYVTPRAATVIPIELSGTQPQFACSIDNLPTTCTVDTGAGESIAFFASFVKAHPIVESTRLTAPGVDSFGVGGPHVGRLGRVQTLSFGGLMLRDLVGDYPMHPEGGLGMPFIGANVGGAVWKRFTMTLDYRRLAMTLTPNAGFEKSDQWDRSGLYLIDNGAITIIGVRPGTPAAKAGLANDDAITSVNGSSTLSLHQVRDAFLGEPGTVVHLVVKSGDGRSRTVNLTLADYV